MRTLLLAIRKRRTEKGGLLFLLCFWRVGGCFSGEREIRVEMSRAALLLLCLLGCNVWKAVTKTLQEQAAAQEVTLKVHVSDASTHQPIAEAFIEIFTNQTAIASGTSGPDGIAFIKFHYRLGSQLIITATKHAYVPNSAPWRPTRLPVFSSLSLGLLPERSATLMVYEDIVQIVSGFQGNGSRFQLTPVTAVSIHLLNNDGTEIPVNGPIYATVPLPANSNLKHGDHVLAWRFDQKLGAWLKSSLGLVQQEGSQLTWTYIAPQMGYWVAAMSPISPGPPLAKDITSYHTVFLLAILGGMTVILLVLLCLLLYYCRRKCLKPRQHHRKLQLSSALDSSKKDQATSMSHINLISAVHMEMVSSSGEADMHTPMLKPSYSTSREFSSREELLSQKERDKSRTSLDNLTPRETLRKDFHKSVEAFPLKTTRSIEKSEGYESPVKDDYRRSYNSVVSQPLLEKRDKEVQASMNHISTESKHSIREQAYQMPSVNEKEYPVDRRPPDYMMSRSVDHLERPTSFPRPGQLICCSSVDQVNDSAYRKVLPTLVIPAHYMKLPGEHPYVGQPLVVPTEQQIEMERFQAEFSVSHQQLLQHSQQMQPASLTPQAGSQQHLQDVEGREWGPQASSISESVSIPASLSEAALAQMNGEVQLLTEKAIMELGGGKPLPHPRAWFVSLDGRSNAHVRHSYIDLQRAGRNGSNDASLDSGVDMNEPKFARKSKAEQLQHLHRQLRQQQLQQQQQEQEQLERQQEHSVSDGMAYTQLVYLDDMEQSGSESGTAVCSPEENSLRPLLDCPTKRSVGTLPRQQEGLLQRIVESEPPTLPSPENVSPSHDDSTEDQGENKKSPWQKREERPLMAFNLK
ncbi:protein FAM171A1 isoform X2 [Latimeria chalumnae]|uniref:protein FAM171A1 isoform X2 n=1 Tax=Latimeria chalumnae TaxID=7897 RepID=UPI00313D78C1